MSRARAATAAGEDASPPAAPETPEVEWPRYRVKKALTVDTGRTLMPGETLVMNPSEWPARRAKQLTDQGYIESEG